MKFRTLAATAMIAGTLGVLASPAGANSGMTHAKQDCNEWSATVTLDHNVLPDRTVDVITTIPGTHGFTGHHYNTSFGEIWSESGPAVAHGTVTLNIYFANGRLEDTDSATLPTPENCETTTTTATTATTSTTATTVPHETTVPQTTAPHATTTTTFVTTVTTPPNHLPFTGSTTAPLIATGVGFVALGAYFMSRARRKAT